MYKHSLELSKAFLRTAKKLDKKHMDILERKLSEIANDPLGAGKRLKGPLKEILAVRLNKRYRVFYKIPRKCSVHVLNIYHRESAY